MGGKELVDEILAIRDLLKARLKRFEVEQTKVKKIKEFNALTEVMIKNEHAIALLNTTIWLLK